jgi:GT2 family glycosyltransferase
MTLIAMAVWDTEENNRSWMTEKTINSIIETVDFKKHRLFVIDNASCKKTKDILYYAKQVKALNITVITNEENIGTAEAINLAWKQRNPGEGCIKMDNDVVIYSQGWLEEMENVVRLDPRFGQVALKRKDIWENPYHENPFYRSELAMLHPPGGRWTVVEIVNHCIGTCVYHSSALLDKVGYLKQPLTYGLDDSLMSARSRIAGFLNAFLPHIEIDHIDTGGGPYQDIKVKVAGESWEEYKRLLNGYKDGSIPIYYNPFQ